MFTLCAMNELLNQIIDHFGSQANLARTLKIKSMAITNWRKRKSIPAIRAYQIQKITRGKFKASNIIELCDSGDTVIVDSVCGKSPHGVGKSRLPGEKRAG